MPSANHPTSIAATPPVRERVATAGAATTDRRDELIHKAAHLFRAKGFKGTTTRDIAAAANMQSGSPFYYFKSKGELLCAVMQEGMAIATASQSKVLAAMAPNTPSREQLRALTYAHLRVLFGSGRNFMPVLMYEWPWLTDDQRQAVAAQKDSYEAAWMPALRGLHREGKLRSRPEVARFFIFGALNWTVHWYRPDGVLTIAELATEAMKLFVDPAQGRAETCVQEIDPEPRTR